MAGLVSPKYARLTNAAKPPTAKATSSWRMIPILFISCSPCQAAPACNGKDLIAEATDGSFQHNCRWLCWADALIESALAISCAEERNSQPAVCPQVVHRRPQPRSK